MSLWPLAGFEDVLEGLDDDGVYPVVEILRRVKLTGRLNERRQETLLRELYDWVAYKARDPLGHGFMECGNRGMVGLAGWWWKGKDGNGSWFVDPLVAEHFIRLFPIITATWRRLLGNRIYPDEHSVARVFAESFAVLQTNWPLANLKLARIAFERAIACYGSLWFPCLGAGLGK